MSQPQEADPDRLQDILDLALPMRGDAFLRDAFDQGSAIDARVVAHEDIDARVVAHGDIDAPVVDLEDGRGGPAVALEIAADPAPGTEVDATGL